MSSKQWTTPRPPTAEEKTSSLRRGLLWTYGLINAGFLSWIIGIYIIAAGQSNGDAFHDLGVALGRELALHQAYQYWIFTALTAGVAFTALHFTLKERWKR